MHAENQRQMDKAATDLRLQIEKISHAQSMTQRLIFVGMGGGLVIAYLLQHFVPRMTFG
jgi:fructoselysine-6-P-deglycase FrlB-like protein